MLPDPIERQKLLDAWWKLTGREDFSGTVRLPVLTGSMAPSIPVGSEVAIVSARSRSFGVGDVVVFRKDDRLVAHRLLLCLGNGPGAPCYEKGDLNAGGGWIRRRQVLGVVVDRTAPADAPDPQPLTPRGIVFWSVRQGLRARWYRLTDSDTEGPDHG